MSEFKKINDTIAAIATPVGQGGIGIVRLSGNQAFRITEEIFVAKASKKKSLENGRIHYGWIIDSNNNDEPLDEVLVMAFRAPQSYTQEDVIEINCHGGIVVLKSILSLILEKGARLAEPGEFTKRAFLNGRIDLTQAEAVLDIIQSKTDAFLRVSTHQLKGELAIVLEAIREELMNVYTQTEAFVNFPEDEIDKQSQSALSHQILLVQNRISELLVSSAHGRVLKEGMSLVLCGKTNVGKSSLLNALLKTPRAIVSPIAGTTRDTIEEMAQIQGIPFQMIDTAGFLNPSDMIEEEAIRRSRMSLEKAEFVLFVLDLNQNLTQEDFLLMEQIKHKSMIVVLNKKDLKQNLDEKELQDFLKEKDSVKVSAVTQEGIRELEEKILEHVWQGKIVDTHGVLISNLRHIESLKHCEVTLLKAQDILKNDMPLEFVSEEIKEAIHFLDEITGRDISQDLLEKIFSQFCIGK
ncbi:MAG TPA: tRNA uridine-5-carboxymethylaminomethyl(34) synthesis GTPase MnmE [Candidatus Omnitrophota bacterium]|nr:tRNA uridine-5-carboxymethylaminomethyl(34) synthesis GTPase MnmE [Candidatus Omnitrophota bacterium]HPN88308.1 tRNA uridine-5-carboxymethylaminomethyl(34) synthesis GTPase MnmE [Candidatus Omnitrophota bacterium]